MSLGPASKAGPQKEANGQRGGRTKGKSYYAGSRVA